MSDQAEPEVSENVEMELRGRLTVLEDWRPRVESALGLIGWALVGLSVAGLLLSVVLRKRHS